MTQAARYPRAKPAEIPDPAVEPTVTIERASSILGIGRGLAYAAAKRGEIPVLHLGRALRVPTAELLKMLGQ